MSVRIALPGRCILCSFRRLSLPCSKTVVPLQHAFSTSLSSRQRDFPKRKPPATSDRRPHSKSRGPRHVSKRVLSDEHIYKRTMTCFKNLKERLERTKATQDGELSQLAALDPTGDFWDPYEEELERLLASPGEAQSVDEQRLFSAIGSANVSEDWRQEVERALHFGFIDYVLARNNVLPTNKLHPYTDMRYPTEWYSGARSLQREIHLHVGPTNSGKTYNALKRLEEVGTGFYAGPLRLLAHEVYTRFRAKGVGCDLVTGDDVRLDEDPNLKLYASTVEMVDVGRPVEVAVIDEIQMMASEDRGWAWTRAFLGANAKEVHLCGEPRVVPLIRELAASIGDTLHIHEYQRLNPLRVMSKSLGGDLRNLRKGDCVVSFSIMNIHALKKQIEIDTGKRCAIVYGGLPPETRAQQAALFNDPDNDFDFLVASDAIGMGLNLSVKRVIFQSTSKYNGLYHEQLSTAHIKQIGGRAGRYRSAHQAMKGQNSGKQDDVSVGLVTTLHEDDLKIVRAAMNSEPPPITKAGILPPGDVMEEYAAKLPKGIPFEYVMRRTCDYAETHRRFILCDITEQSKIARTLEQVPGLTISQRFIFGASPSNLRTSIGQEVTVALAKCVGEQRQVTIADIPELPLEILEKPLSGDRVFLENLEQLHKALILYLWLSYRFINVFKDRDMAVYAKSVVEEKINTCLVEFSANPELRKRVLTFKKRMHISGEPTIDEEGETSISQVQNPEALPIDWMKGSSEGELRQPESAVTRVSSTG